MNNIVEAVFGSCNPYECATRILYRYDYGMILTFPNLDLPTAYEVHFSNYDDVGTTITQIGNEDGVSIPDEFLQTGLPVYCWVYLHTGEDDGETVYKVTINVQDRPQPSNGTPTPVQQDAITEAIAALNSAVEQTGADASSANADALKSEGYAVGTQDGEPVEQGSPYYRHNSLWLSQQAGQSANKAEAQASLSEAWAVGEISGHPVPSDYPQYENNSKYYAEQASQSAEDAEASAQSVLGLTADASVDANVGTPSVDVVVTEESDHKKMTFTFRNLKGVQGDQGIGIASVVLNADYTLTITLTNGTSYTTSSIRGEVGATPNLTIGTVSTLPEGSQATATITGTDEDPVLNLGIPVGDTGDPGISPTITVTEITGGHEVAVTDAEGTQTFNVMDGEVSEQDLEDALIDKADVITSSASGEIVTIQDGAKNLPVVDLDVSLLPVQDLHGQQNPYPGGGYKNLIYGKIDVDESANGIRLQYNHSTEAYTVSGTNESSSVFKILGWVAANGNLLFPPFAVGETYTLFVDINLAMYMQFTYYTTNSGTSSLGYTTFANGHSTFTIPNDFSTLRELQIYVGSSATSLSGTFHIWLEKGSVASSMFTPYSNVCPISGWTGVDVYQVRKNFCHLAYIGGSNALYDNRTDNSVRVYATTSTVSYKYCKFSVASADKLRGKVVTLSCSVTNDTGSASPRTLGRFVDSNNSSIGSAVFEVTVLSIKQTFTVPASLPDGAKICLYLYCDSGTGGEQYKTWSNIQLELGSEQTSFEPYNGNNYPIDWSSEAGAVYGCNIDPVSGVLTVDMGMVDLGDLGWAYNSNQNRFDYDASIGLKPPANNNTKANMICSMYRTGTTNSLGYFEIGANTNGYIRVKDARYTTAAAFIEAVSGVQLVYELATPLTFQLSETQIATFLGQNNFCSNGNGTLDLEYRCDTKLYIENLTKPSEDDMVANQNITASSFFMVGNRLFLSSVAIGQGETIVPGTNCTEVSLADALNQINA